MEKWKNKCEILLSNQGIIPEIYFNKLLNSSNKDKFSMFDYKILYFELRNTFHIDFLEEYQKRLKKNNSFSIKDI